MNNYHAFAKTYTIAAEEIHLDNNGTLKANDVTIMTEENPTFLEVKDMVEVCHDKLEIILLHVPTIEERLKKTMETIHLLATNVSLLQQENTRLNMRLVAAETFWECKDLEMSQNNSAKIQ